MDKLEIRNYSTSLKSDDGRFVEGYGSVFNSRSHDLGGFHEIISPGAFDGVIEKSNVKCYLNHDSSRGILARCKNGQGSLKLEIDERGLKYSFEAPHTVLGDEVVEGLKRGDYDESSFAFTVESESWTKEEDGTYLRTINKIKRLYDVSIVADGAYGDTTVALRSLDEFKEKEKEKPEEIKDDTTVEEQQVKEDTTVDSEDDKEKKEEEDKPKDKPEDKPEGQDESEPKDKRNNNNKNNMKNFSLIKAINDVVNNRNINEDALSVIEMGAKEMRKSGLSYSGQIQLPVEERVDTDGAIVATVATQGQEIVPTDKLNILEPLRGKSILSEVGATFLTGLVGNISIPTYSGTTCGWKGEMSAADDGKGTFDSVELSPKRLTAYIDISKQFLVQDSVGAEEMLRTDIVNALVAKLEQTIFGDAVGDATKPAGIFNGATVAAPSYEGVCEAEAALTDFLGEKKFVMSPTAKSAFKQTTVSGQKSDLRLLMQGNEVDGYSVAASSNVVSGGYAFGDFRELVVAQWGSIDIVVDPYTLATKNAIRLVINAFFDAKVRRDGAIKAYKIA